MNDHYEMQIGDLKDELLLVEEQLVRAEDVIRFYSELENWNIYKNEKAIRQHIRVSPMSDCNKYSDAGYELVLGGKRARNYFKEKSKE